MEKTHLTYFLKQNWILILILFIGATFRLYNISGYMTFLGDEGRDVLIVRNLLTKTDPILIGPGTSTGNMYLGPLYYYFMAPFLFLTNFSPIGPAIGVALLGIATIYLVYIVGRDWFNKYVGLVGSFLYAISPTVITYSRSSWNPNIMPFFALLSIYVIWKVWKEHKHMWLMVCAISFAFVLQSHYLGIFIAPVLLVLWYLSKPKDHIRYSIYSVLIFLFLMSPLVIFDIRHDFLNAKALYNFLTVGQETVSVNFWTIVTKSISSFFEVNISLLVAKNIVLGKILSVFLFLYIVFVKKGKSIWLIIFWLLSAVIGLGLYKGNIYDHYFGFLFPVPFLLISLFLYKLFNSKFKLFSICLFMILVFINLKNNPLRFYPNNQMQRAQNVTQKVIEESKNKQFNFAVVAQRNYEDGYQYFLEKENANFVEIDAQILESVTDQLFVICENEESKCDPTHSSKAEVANFGWSKVENQWTVDGVIIYKLIHTL